MITRRSFLRLLGLGSAAAIVVPSSFSLGPTLVGGIPVERRRTGRVVPKNAFHAPTFLVDTTLRLKGPIVPGVDGLVMSNCHVTFAKGYTGPFLWVPDDIAGDVQVSHCYFDFLP